MYSQRDEEEVILKNAPATGRFLDIGAYDFKAFSNTRALAEKGWGGVLVEPSPASFARMMENAKGFDLTLINALVDPRVEGLVHFYANDDAVATTEEKNKKIWEGHVKFTDIWACSVKLETILNSFGPFDFISIDTEGTSVDLLKAINFDVKPCNLVCVEYDAREEETRAHFDLHGFDVIHKTAENLIARRRRRRE